MNLVAIPLADRLWGNAAIGAAITTVITELFMGIAAWMLLGPLYRDGRAAASTLWRALVACAVMAGPVLMVRDALGLAAAVGVGVLVYGAVAMALRLVSLDDMRQLRGALRGS